MARGNSYNDESSGRTRIRTSGPTDFGTLILIIILMTFGIIMVYSASYYYDDLSGNPGSTAKKQILFTIIGLAAMLIISKIDYRIYSIKIIQWVVYIGTVVLILAAKFLGKSTNGASRWLTIGGVSIQPSELAKTVVVILTAYLIAKNRKYFKNFSLLRMASNDPRRFRFVLWKLFVSLFPALIMLILCGIESFSAAFVIAAITGVILFIGCRNLKLFTLAAVIGILAAGMIYGARSYRSDRVSSFEFFQEDTETGAVTQTTAALNAVGSGGIIGKGLGQSLQKMGAMTEVNNDMIFSIVCEEFGFVGAVGVILMYVVLLWRMTVIAANAYDRFGALIVAGSITHVAIQVIINMCVVTSLFPNTGVTLPFISAGGSSLVFMCCELGVVLNVARSASKEVVTE